MSNGGVLGLVLEKAAEDFGQTQFTLSVVAGARLFILCPKNKVSWGHGVYEIMRVEHKSKQGELARQEF